MRTWTKNSQPLPPGLPADLRDFMEQARQLPSWTDQGKLATAFDFNEKRSKTAKLGYDVEGADPGRRVRRVPALVAVLRAHARGDGRVRPVVVVGGQRTGEAGDEFLRKAALLFLSEARPISIEIPDANRPS